MQAAVATIGPISVCIDASENRFYVRAMVETQCFMFYVLLQFYKSGVYANPFCSEYDTDHCVLVVGYNTTSSGEDYWIVKNRYSN